MRFEKYRTGSKGLSALAIGRPTEWRWRLRAANGKIIADSGEGYQNEADCDKGIALVMSTNVNTPIIVVQE